MENKDLKKLSNSELDRLLNECDWCNKTLLKEHDERCQDGRIPFKEIPLDKLEEHIKNKYSYKNKRSA